MLFLNYLTNTKASSKLILNSFIKYAITIVGLRLYPALQWMNIIFALLINLIHSSKYFEIFVDSES